MPPKNATDKLVELQLYFRDHPVEFVRHIFKVEPTSQQIELINIATKPNGRVAVKSATATGKTSTLAWLTFYFLLCYPDCKGLVTAPTASQLFRVFRSELCLWHGKMEPVFQDMFEIMNEKVFVKGKKDTQFFSWVTGTAENKESFAGLHAQKVVLMVDEASALPSSIFDTLYGTLSSGDTSFILVSNPVRAEGAFYDLFHQEDSRKTFKCLTFTSFDSPNVDTNWIDEIRAYYKEDSDFWKMRVLGEFPLVSEAQFISTDLVERAFSTVIAPQDYHNFPRILGCDVARFGSDCSVIVDRQGPKVHNIISYKGLDTVAFAEKILNYITINKHAFQCIPVDGIGVGAGVVDQLKRFSVPVMDVNVGSSPRDIKMYANLRAELWGELKDWLGVASIPTDSELRDQLVGINYSFNSKMQILLESKKDMKRRGTVSPDKADALSLTFAPQVFAHLKQRSKPRMISKSTYLWA